MNYALEERIGDPDLFTGRKEELVYFLKWLDGIKKRISQSTALMARRKMGKTALMERLFNITFAKNDGVIPFYYEVKEIKMWVVDFCVDFFMTFIYQYIAFKTSNHNYVRVENKTDFDKVKTVAEGEGLGYLTGIIEGVENAVRLGYVDILWGLVREAPQTIAANRGEFIVQLIDEFQFLNAMIYWDKGKKNLADTLAGGYLSTAESKIAPLLVSGSWVGWLMNELNSMLPARFNYHYLENMPEPEAVEMVFKYSRFFDVPVTEETAYLISRMTEGSPFYISSILRSPFKQKDLTAVRGLTDTLEFETLNNRGKIKSTWMEYISSAFKKVNGKNAKTIVLYLCRHREREVTRKELLEKLSLDMDDTELEEKMDALVKADIVGRGQTYYDYRGVTDNIFDKVFRGVYEKEIREFDVKVIREEYNEKFETLKKQYNRLLGTFNRHKGYFAEYLILDQLLYRARKKDELLRSITRYLPGDFHFCDYSRVWRYDGSPEFGKNFNVDVFARSANENDYSIIGEVKSREARKFSKEEAEAFAGKYAEVKQLENIDRAVGFIFSRCGFTKEAEAYCRENGIACSEDERWLDS